MHIQDLLKRYSDTNSKCKLDVLQYYSPIGNIIAGADENFLYFASIEDSKKLEHIMELVSEELSCRFRIRSNKILLLFATELDAYFAGVLRKFSTPFKTFGSDYSKKVWAQLVKIPYATTETYGGIAEKMEKSKRYCRSVGNACNANALILIIPCHRVVGVDSNGGFNCGTARKLWLLEHEQKHCYK